MPLRKQTRLAWFLEDTDGIWLQPWPARFRFPGTVPPGCTTLPCRTPLAWPTPPCSGGFDAAGTRRSPTRHRLRHERPEASAEPRRPVSPHRRLWRKSLGSDWGSVAARGEREGWTNLSQRLQGLINIRSSGGTAASWRSVTSPCLCTFRFWARRPKGSSYWRWRRAACCVHASLERWEIIYYVRIKSSFVTYTITHVRMVVCTCSEMFNVACSFLNTKTKQKSNNIKNIYRI